MIKLNLDNIKAVVFDFDNTLCIYDSYDEEFEDIDKLYPILKEKGYTYYDEKNCTSNKQLKEFIKLVRDRNKDIPMFLCSGIYFPKEGFTKIEWVYKNYNVELRDACVTYGDNSIVQSKVKILYAITTILKCKPEEILFVDDSWSTVYECAKKGYNAVMPMNIVNFMNN